MYMYIYIDLYKLPHLPPHTEHNLTHSTCLLSLTVGHIVITVDYNKILIDIIKRCVCLVAQQQRQQANTTQQHTLLCVAPAFLTSLDAGFLTARDHNISIYNLMLNGQILTLLPTRVVPYYIRGFPPIRSITLCFRTLGLTNTRPPFSFKSLAYKKTFVK